MWWAGLAQIVGTPRAPTNNRPVLTQRHGVVITGRNRDYIRETYGNVRVMVEILPPSKYLAIAAKRQAEPASCCQAHDVREAWWDACLSQFVVAPGNHCAVAFQCESVIVSSSNIHDVGKPRHS